MFHLQFFWGFEFECHFEWIFTNKKWNFNDIDIPNSAYKLHFITSGNIEYQSSLILNNR